MGDVHSLPARQLPGHLSKVDADRAASGFSTLRRLYPEVQAGGFSRVDGNIEFYSRVNALLTPEMVVVDFGAGRGKDATDDPVEFRRNLRNLQGKAAEVIGVDVDPAVLSNPSVDRAIVALDDQPLPLSDDSVDLIVSDFCFEHIQSPVPVTRELDRVLKVGGWICARTPNRWGYIGIGATGVPNRYHTRLLTRLQPGRQAKDVFPTAYRLNTRRQLRRYFPSPRYLDCTYGHNSEPAYFGTSLFASRTARTVFKLAPERVCALWYVFVQKQEGHATS